MMKEAAYHGGRTDVVAVVLRGPVAPFVGDDLRIRDADDHLISEIGAAVDLRVVAIGHHAPSRALLMHFDLPADPEFRSTDVVAVEGSGTGRGDQKDKGEPDNFWEPPTGQRMYDERAGSRKHGVLHHFCWEDHHVPEGAEWLPSFGSPAIRPSA